ncbi:hypothetical protein JCM16303_006707 [Sporobolomyces ruberrimus]
MLADLDLALKQPLQLIEKLYVEGSWNLDQFEHRIESTFSTLLKDARDQLPAITSLSDQSRLPSPGTLVRFRAMVQDTGYGTELYRAIGAKDQLLMYGLEETADDSDNSAAHEDYSKLKERQIFYVVSPPGETKWVKGSLDGHSSQEIESGLSNLSLSPPSAPSATTSMPEKIPLPFEPNFGLITKIYTDLGDKLRSTDVYEFVGILGETPLTNAFDVFEHSDSASPPRSVPALHVLYALPSPSPFPTQQLREPAESDTIRHELIKYIAREGGLGQDLEAAEWVLLALIARIHTRHATGLALGSLSLNLSLPLAPTNSSTTETSPSSSLIRTLSALVPSLAPLSLTINSLNDPSSRFSPRSRDESLDSGMLQLTKGTNVVIDLTKLGEGKLNDTGVRNLRSLSTTVSQQKLVYEFPFSSFELETDLGFLVVSEGKAIVPTDCVVYVEPTRTSAGEKEKRESPSEEELNRFRSFLQDAKYSQFSIPPSMSDVIQSDFVERRQSSHAGGSGGAMTQEDLLFRMTVSRLMALSYGKRELDSESWTRTAELDERRKERVPLVVRQRQQQEVEARSRKGGMD